MNDNPVVPNAESDPLKKTKPILNGKQTQRRYMLATVVVVIATVSALLAATLNTRTASTFANTHALSALRSLQAADYVKLSATMAGTLVAGNKTQFVTAYVKTSTIQDDVSLNVDALVTYQSGDIAYDISIVGGRGYYIVSNETSDEVFNVACVHQSDMPPLATLAASLMKATSINADAPYTSNVADILECPNADDIMEVTWAKDHYVLCVPYDEITAEHRISSAARDGMSIQIDYLDASEISPAIKSALETVPSVPSFKGKQDCPVLDLEEYENAAVAAVHARYLTSEKPRKKWYETSRGISEHPGRRELFTAYSFYVETTTEEYDAFNSFAVDVLGCTYFCGPAEFGSAQIPLTDLSAVAVIDQTTTFRRKLTEDPVLAHITLPRPCALVHGAGFQDLTTMWNYQSDIGNVDFLFLADHLYDYFGEVELQRPCYCSSMSFVMMDTQTLEWYNDELQLYTCRSIALLSNAANTVTVDNSKVMEIANTVVITHFTATLTVAASIANGYCTFGDSSKWASIHTPIGDVAFAANPDGEAVATLCTEENMYQLFYEFQAFAPDYPIPSITRRLNHRDRSTEAPLDITSTASPTEVNSWEDLGPLLSITTAGGNTLEEVFNACSYVEEDIDWITRLNPKDFPENVTELFLQTHDVMVEHVDAALCGYGQYGLLSSKRLINELTQELVDPDVVSDGITSLESCLALADIKAEAGETITFSSDPMDPYYSGASHNTDVQEFRDGWTGERAEMRTWVNSLRMHEDM